MVYVCVVDGNVVSGFITAKFVIKIRKIRDCAAGNVVSFTDTVWLLGVVLVLLEVWLADTVPAWLAGEEVALPEFAGAEL